MFTQNSGSETDVLKEDVEFNPERLEWVNERLNTLYTLEQKHRVPTVEELIAIQDKYTEQLHDIDSFDEQIEGIKAQLEISYQELLQQAAVLSEQRKIASKAIASQLVKMVNIGRTQTFGNLPGFWIKPFQRIGGRKGLFDKLYASLLFAIQQFCYFI